MTLRRRLLLLIEAAVLVGSGLGRVDLAAADERLRAVNGTSWMTNRTGAVSSVTVLDAGTGAMVGTVTVGSKPTSVVATADKVYVSNRSPSNSISVVSKETLSVVSTIPTGATPVSARLDIDARGPGPPRADEP